MQEEVSEAPLLYDHYAVERVLGTGAMGVVYLARDVRLGRRAAVKTLHARRHKMDDPEAERTFERFRREAQLCGALVHPNIVTLYEAGYEGRRFTYLAMEYVEGESLQTLLKRSKVLPITAAARIADDVLQGLAYAHAQGIIHRDIKPANVLLSMAGQAKIADFGIATSSQARMLELTEKGQLLGTPHYMAPEQIAGREVDHRADLFSVGVLLYEMLAGRKPFDGAALTDVLYDVVHREATPLEEHAPEVPEWLTNFVSRLLKKQAQERFADAAEASRELRALLTQHQLSETSLDLPPLSVLSVEHTRSPEDTPTTPIHVDDLPRAPITLDRQISSRAAVALLLVTLTITGGAVVLLLRQIDETPTASLTPEQVRLFEQKRSDLREASLLYQVGAYDESLKRLDAYLEKHPQSEVAREYRDKTVAAIRKRSEAAKRPSVTVARKRSEKRAVVASTAATTAETTTPTEKIEQAPEPRPGVWSRIKSFFRGER